MANYQLLPGFGGKVSYSFTITENEAATYSDTYDTSRCAQLAAQVTSVTGDASDATLSLQLQQSLDGTSFANVGSPQTVVVGDTVRYSHGSGPYALVRLKLTATETDAVSSSSHDSGTVVIALCGWPLPVCN